MIQIFFYYLTLQLIVSLFFKRDRSMLICGLSAFSPVKGLTAEQRDRIWRNMKLLGIYNQSRGEHSCGLQLNGKVYKGVDDKVTKIDTSKFTDFLAENRGLKYEKGVIMIHTRHATSGAWTAANSHPFEIESINGPERNFNLMHNGVIQNIVSLTGKHDIKYADYTVDSHGLALLIDKVGFSILNDYEGKAALIWNYLSEPTTLHVYHGMYCELPTDPIEKSWEERPMYFLETEEGMYFSSMQSSLESIAEKDQVVKTYIYNEIHKVKDGRWVSKFCHKVDRLYGPNTKVPYVAPVHDWTRSRNHLPVVNNNINVGVRVPQTNLVWNEALPTQAKSQRLIAEERVYFHRGRFFRTGAILCSGCMYLDSKGNIYSVIASNASEYFFFNGIMLKSEKDYSKIFDLSQEKDSWINSGWSNKAKMFSEYSVYPVTNYLNESTSAILVDRFAWYANKEKCKRSSFSVKFSSRHYTINADSFLEEITTSDKKNDKIIWLRDDTAINKPILDASKTLSKEKYDTNFYTVDEAMKAFNNTQYNALKMYCKNILKSKMSLDPDDTEIDNEVILTLTNAVNKKISVRAELEDDDESLEWYEQVFLANGIAKLKPRYTFYSTGTQSRVANMWDNSKNEWVLQTKIIEINKNAWYIFQRYSLTRRASAHSTETNPGKMWDTHMDVWVKDEEVCALMDADITKLIELDESSFIVDDTIEYSYSNETGANYTNTDELLHTDPDGYHYVVRDSKNVYLEEGKGLKLPLISIGEKLTKEEIDLELEEDIEAQEEKMFETNLRVSDLIQSLGELNREVDELTELNDDTLCAEIIEAVNKSLDTLKHKLADITTEHGCDDLTLLINQTLNIAI